MQSPLESQLTGLDEDLPGKSPAMIYGCQLLLAFQNQTMGAFYQASGEGDKAELVCRVGSDDRPFVSRIIRTVLSVPAFS